MKTLKQHPIAWSIYALYMCCWLAIGYTAFIDFNGYGDGRNLGVVLFLFLVCGFMPYLVITFIISEMSGDNTRPFYLLLTRMILGSFPIVLITGTVLNFLI